MTERVKPLYNGVSHREGSANTMPTKKSIRDMRYDQKATKHYGLKFNIKTDADIIARIEEQDGFQGYIKRLIREDIARNGGSQAEITDA